MTDIKDRLHNLMLRSGWQSREDQETILAGVKEIERLRAALESINRQASNHNITFDQWLRHVDGIADTARLALKAQD